jgi:hypothetical protein
MNFVTKRTVEWFICFLLLGLVFTSASAAPSAERWPLWEAHQSSNKKVIDHSAWRDFLAHYLVTETDSGINLLRYAKVTAADRTKLAQYLIHLQNVPINEFSRPVQKAFWINLYNALTVQTILQNYPLKSIRDIKSGWFSAGPWDLKLARISGEELSLNDVEHRILRPIWRDNRVHYAVNCASLGCPNLQPEPFTAENSERLLDQSAHDFINSPRGAHFSGSRLILSSIYDWFQSDFGDSEQGVLSHLEKFATPELAGRLIRNQGSIAYDYDWTLNGG